MHTGSRLILIGFLLLVGVLFLLMLGPLGLVLIPLGLIVAGFVLLTADESDSPRPVNCEDCGAPNEADADTCRYCGTSLTRRPAAREQ